MNGRSDVFAVVVTYNRRQLLEQCLRAIAQQTALPPHLVIVDNASTDGTAAWLKTWLPGQLPIAEVVSLTENRGGAGGFAEGMRVAIGQHADWIWMMDDDAAPHPMALEELMKIAADPGNVYGSLATNGADTSWTTTLLDPSPHAVDTVDAIPSQARVQSLPFLGFLVHRDLVGKIGLPDAGYFIAADDIEYCIRAERAGAQLIIVGQSRIEHPKSDRYEARLPGRRLICLRLPPWKRYYDTRNRLLIARKYYGLRLLTQTIPGSFVRMYAALRYEPRRLAQLWAFGAGMFDGLLGIKGRRHAKWGIRQ
jgi:rhamnopyranosyl-N-acetylglucosaminyl-diphospho-decaprenol beta-1,3/1,4-galactofuranosyltransferase